MIDMLSYVCVRERKKKGGSKMKRIVCERCGKTTGYVRIETKEWVCRSCGNIQPLFRKKIARKDNA